MAAFEEQLQAGLKSCRQTRGYLLGIIWKMLDEIAKNREQGNVVLGGIDNTSIAPDISYEMDVLMEQTWFSAILEIISDES